MPSNRGLSLKSALLRNAGFFHGFSTKTAGSPEGFAAFLADAGIDGAQLRQVHQVHGPRAVRAPALPTPAIEADALVAIAPLAVAVRVADCVPILFADPSSGAVAAVHAGWRGLVSGVIGAAAHAMSEIAGATSRGGWLAAIGPCIGPCCFEVGTDVAHTIGAAVDSDAVITRTLGDKAFVDLRAGVRLRLAAAGLSSAHVEDIPGCTKCDDQQFFSYRRDGANAGRLFAAIAAR